MQDLFGSKPRAATQKFDNYEDLEQLASQNLHEQMMKALKRFSEKQDKEQSNKQTLERQGTRATIAHMNQ